MKETKAKFIKLLQKAYSGEMAAALAYNGHWKSLKNELEIKAVQQIEVEEWRHRRQIGGMLSELNVKPLFFREILFYLTGKSIAFICRFCGRFCSTYFAGILESKNVAEYRQAFEYAESIGLNQFLNEFTEMGKTEAEHELILLEMISEHRRLPWFAFFFGWGKLRNFAYQKQNGRF